MKKTYLPSMSFFYMCYNFVMKKGLFITFEGPDGSGKTTVSMAVVERLQKEGYAIKYTREPGGSNIAEKIREIILDPNNTEMDERCEALLYAASRRQHLVEKVLPALKEGITVISDRFVDSSLAYQGYARGIGMEEVYAINLFAIEGKLPDKTIYLDVDAKCGLDRINANRTTLDRLDAESEEFHNKVHEGYEKVVHENKSRMVIIDATKDVDVVIDEAYHIVKELIDD